MHLFYTPDITSENYTLNEEESRHCAKVLRLEKGDVVYLIDGKGGLYTAEIADSHPKHTELRITTAEKEYGKRNHYLHLAVAPTKNIDRFEWFLEKATEIGIDAITPIICDRSERKEIKTERLNRVITAAVKQSLKAYHPHLNEPVKLKHFLNRQIAGQKFIAHCINGEKSALKKQLVPNGTYTILIGPEGDFTPEEINLSAEFEFIPITLGNSRLRTETAALEACFEVNFMNR
ncbi:16S rRNA (uracil(1498)-N(3))-methyltransferase [Rubrolithibacter danxiaensis]|uniref:16S rRNA (uracil(1498)-N(3))-methyltransferase n=1 Tax=Rubrolithibacter danxiaensis TaxID=3390805 RepID=UPI003BF7E4CB